LHFFSQLGIALMHFLSELGEVGASASVEIERQSDDHPQQGDYGLVHEVLLI